MTVHGKIELPALALYLMVKLWYNAKFQLDWFLCNLVNCFSLLLLLSVFLCFFYCCFRCSNFDVIACTSFRHRLILCSVDVSPREIYMC